MPAAAVVRGVALGEDRLAVFNPSVGRPRQTMWVGGVPGAVVHRDAERIDVDLDDGRRATVVLAPVSDDTHPWIIKVRDIIFGENVRSSFPQTCEEPYGQPR